MNESGRGRGSARRDNGRGKGRGRGGNRDGKKNKGHQNGNGGNTKNNRSGSEKRRSDSKFSSKQSASGNGGGSGKMQKQQKDRQPKLQQQQQPKREAFKRSGEKGAEAHTVSEETRIKFTKMMLDLRENEGVNSIEMPCGLSNTERKFLHVLSAQLGLKSKSNGKGEERRITITKLNLHSKNSNSTGGEGGSKQNDESLQNVQHDLGLPLLNVGQCGHKELASYIHDFPPTSVEEAEAIETGSSLWNKLDSNPKLCASNIDDASNDKDEVIQGQIENETKTNVSGYDNDDDGGDEIILNTLNELNIQTNTEAFNTSSSVKNGNKSKQQQHHQPRQVNLKRRKENHHLLQQARARHKNYKHMQKIRSKLPAYNYQSDICNVIHTNRVTILSGDTGCGKSTQVPQFLLDDKTIGPSCNIVVTQPRRISCISIAERIASERCEEVGMTVGYNIRLETCASNKTQLMFVTPGILLRKFQSDPDLGEFTHIIIDEIHERDKHTEFLMIALRELINRRKDLNVVLMSATIQTSELMEYWSSTGSLHHEDIQATIDDGGHRPAEINIPGRTFPVQEFFLEDVLTMTGFVNDSAAYFGDAMDEVESNLAALLNKQGNRSRTNNQKANQSTLTCIMCNRSGFTCAEELGTHVAICDGGGGGNYDAIELEEKVRSVDTSRMVVFQGNQEQEEEFNYEIEEDISVDEDTEALDGLRMGKWDGESPFAVSDNIQLGSINTLTEDEMLNRYQSIHDDEFIDNELALEVIKYVCKSSYGDGAILVFLPGWQEISELNILLESTPPFQDKSKYTIFPLHSGVPSREQRLVFQRPRKGVRKIILATNIAETSITIDDVAFVVDSGRAKEKNYDPHLRSSTLQPVWISQASAKQRKGRAGRTKAGVCFHLFSRRRHESLRPFLESELLRTSLEEIVLQCKKLGLAPGGPDDDDGVPAFLAAALTPPHPKSVSNALELLVDMGAMDVETNDLTNLGQCLSVLSLEPRVGKMLIWSYILGCTKDAAGMAVSMSYKSPFVLPPAKMRRDAEKSQIDISDGTESDQVTVLNVLNQLDDFHRKGKRNQFYGYCKRNFINMPTITMISDLRKNISRELRSIGFDDPNDLNSWSNRNTTQGNLPFLQAAIAAGLYPNIASRQPDQLKFCTKSNQKAKIHLSSVNAYKGQPLSRKAQMLEYIAYGELVKGVTTYTLNQTTHLASPIPLLLLCGNFRIRPAYVNGDKVSHICVVSVDEIFCQCEKESGFALAILRKRLDDIVEHIVSNPSDGMRTLDIGEWRALTTLDNVIKSAFQSSPGRF